MTKKLTTLQRSRLKLTVVSAVFLYVQTFFPMYVIMSATHLEVFELASAWSAWIGLNTAVASIIGYYMNQETKRPSFVNNTIVDVGNMIEDHDDPEDIPL